MPCAPFAIMIAMTSFLALPIDSALAQDSASDATTPIDKAVGNLPAPTDDTLSNAEVQQLKREGNAPSRQPSAMSPSDDATPSVSGTTPSYKEKSGSAAKTEGQ